jgi:hypothetical protein
MIRNQISSRLFKASLGIVLVAATALPAFSQVTIQFGRGNRRLEGDRLTTMRALAHRLDESARQVARSMWRNPEERTGTFGQRYTWAINDFARQARSLHERLDRYSASPWDVADEITALNARAREVNLQVRRSRAFANTYDDWTEAQNALTLMNRVLRGERITVPEVHRPGYQPFDEGYTYREGRHYQGLDDSRPNTGYVAGNRADEFRRLSESLVVEVDRLFTAARSNAGDRGSSEIRYFSQRVADLDRLSGEEVLNARDLSVTVEGLLQDARRNGQSQPAGRVDWSNTIRILEQMAAIVRVQ